jgi:hypothetical protein
MTLNFIRALRYQKNWRDERNKKEENKKGNSKYEDDSRNRNEEKNKADCELETMMETAVNIITYWL